MRIAAVGCSTQMGLEEPIANRVGRFLTLYLAEAYPDHDVELYNREDYGGTADVYARIADDIDRWGPCLAVHIHADAWKRESYGFSVLYGKEDGHSLANYVYHSMFNGLTPKGYTRGNGIIHRVDRVAVLYHQTPSILVEVGFYSNPRELSLLLTDYYCALVAWAIADGVKEYIKRHIGISPDGHQLTEEDDMPYLELDRREDGGPYVHALNAKVGPDEVVEFFADVDEDYEIDIYAHPMGFKGFIDTRDSPAGGYGNEEGNKGGQFKVSQVTGNFSGKCWLTIHSPHLLHGGVVRG